MTYHVQAGIFKTVGFIQSVATIWFTITHKLTVNTFTRLTLELFRRTSVQDFISFSTFWKGFITNFPQIWAGRVFDDSFIASWNRTYVIVLGINVTDRFIFQAIWVPAVKIRLVNDYLILFHAPSECLIFGLSEGDRFFF
jgi:hypothetical protein